MSSLRTKLVTATAVAAAAIGGATVASAATSGNATSGTTTATADNDHHGPHTVNGKAEAALTGDVAAKVKAAALAKVPGTVERVETNVDSSAPYEAHITKSDGTEVEVQVNSDYSVAAVNTMGHH
ncbi:hypothetical protein [Solirubrobacter soli]|uniref:hypothetical protein n=1 Tax=Solirubrobacter soli TaxID=363832 RepID=UPI000428372D|nr:hypothetical protein [Solirubrobacter soli]